LEIGNVIPSASLRGLKQKNMKVFFLPELPGIFHLKVLRFLLLVLLKIEVSK
jgi:hypothetical protein